jgi:hypothetical protein
MERWSFLVLAGEDGSPTGFRIVLRAGDDEAAWPKVQVDLKGAEVPLDTEPHDYEAPEWKAKQIFAGGESRWEAIKDQLRAKLPG